MGEQNDSLVLTLKLDDNLPDDIKNKLITTQATSDCQFLGRVQLDVDDDGETSPEEIVVRL